jgi:hypothetical protein
MLDKQKLLQWVETKLYVYDGPYDDEADEASCKGRVDLLRILEMDIAAGRLDVTKEG